MTDGFDLATDGRDVDLRLGELSGAAAGQVASPLAPDRPVPGAGLPVWDPCDAAAGAGATYYDLPVVKAPPWGAAVSAYVVLGGLSGASATLAAATQGSSSLRRLTVAARVVATVSGSVGATLLLSDLGRPERFLNMFRVLRPTSPMSVGVYVLSVSTGAVTVATVLGRRTGRGARIGSRVGTVAGIAGVPLAGYTGVLLGTTALPGWNVGLGTLPPLFMASGVATAGSVLTCLPLGTEAAAAVDVYRWAGQLAELAAERVHEGRLVGRPRIAAAYRAEAGWRAGRWLTLASVAAGAFGPVRRRRSGRVLIGGLGVAGAVATKHAVFRAGMATAADPRTTPEEDPPPR